MINRWLACLVAFSSVHTVVEAGVWDKVKSAFVAEKPQPPTIKVLVAHDAEALTIEVKGKYNLYDPYKNKLISNRFVGKNHLMQPLSDGLKWGEKFPGVFQLLIKPDDNNTTTLIDGIEYRGSIYVYDIGGTISVVNEVDIEDYLHSVLSLQLNKPQSDEAMAAVTIAARTHAYNIATSAPNPYWHVDAEKVGYQGHGVTSRIGGLEKALASTKYMVMNMKGSTSNEIVPFSLQLVQSNAERNAILEKGLAGLSIEDAEDLAKRGNHAATILSKAFPDTTISLIHDSPLNASNSVKDVADNFR